MKAIMSVLSIRMSLIQNIPCKSVLKNIKNCNTSGELHNTVEQVWWHDGLHHATKPVLHCWRKSKERQWLIIAMCEKFPPTMFYIQDILYSSLCEQLLFQPCNSS